MATNIFVVLAALSSFYHLLIYPLVFNIVIIRLFYSYLLCVYVCIWGMRLSCAMMPLWSSGSWLHYHIDPRTQARVIRLSSRHLSPWKASHWPFNCQLDIFWNHLERKLLVHSVDQVGL